MGVYSPNMAAHFAEQFRKFTYFNMAAKTNSGYTISSNPVQFWGVLQNNTSLVKESNGNTVQETHENLWTSEKLTIGWYVQFEETIFRIIPSNDWSNEGGFFNYTLERQPGDNGTPDSQSWAFGGVPI